MLALWAPPARAEPIYALVPSRAVLRESPSQDSPRYGPASGERPAVFRRVGVEGDWVQVETLASDDASHCHLTAAPYGMRLRFFVLQSDLDSVVVRKASIVHRDGTAVILEPGVAVRANKGGGYTALLLDFRPRVSLAEGAISKFYAPAPFVEREAKFEIASSDLKAARLGGEPLTPVPGGLLQTFPLFVESVQPTEGGQVIASTSSRCAELKFRVAAAKVAPISDQSILGGLIGSGGPGKWRVRQNAAVWFSSGKRAGETDRPFTLTEPSKLVKGRRCSREEIMVTGNKPFNFVDVCFDAADVAPAKND